MRIAMRQIQVQNRTLRAKILKVKEQTSKFGGTCFLIAFKGDDGLSYRSWLSPDCGNFLRWAEVIHKWTTEDEVWLEGLILKGKGLIDADSDFKVCNG